MHLIKSESELFNPSEVVIEKIVRDEVALEILKWAQEWGDPEVKKFAFVVSRRIRRLLVAE